MRSTTDNMKNDIALKKSAKKQEKQFPSEKFDEVNFQAGFITTNVKHIDDLPWKNRIKLKANIGTTQQSVEI